MVTKPLVPDSIVTGRWTKKKYQVQVLLGQGGCGAVYLVLDRESRKKYALKISQDQTILHKEFNLLKELNLDSKIKNLGLLPLVYYLDDYWMDNQCYPFMVMEYVEGSNLNQLLKKRSQFKLREVVGIGLILSLALEKIHQKKYVYGDLKLENLLYNEKTGQLRMIDLGGMSKMGEAVKAFTPLYDRASWGKGSRRGDCQYDIFALSMLLLILITGKKIKPQRNKGNWKEIVSCFPGEKEFFPLWQIIAKGLKEEYFSAKSIFNDLWMVWQGTRGKGRINNRAQERLIKLLVCASFLFLIFTFWLFST